MIINNVKTTSVMLPYIKYNRYVKPSWTNKGRPTGGRSHQTYVDYGDAKRDFRKEQRRFTADYQSREYEGLSTVSDHSYNPI